MRDKLLSNLYGAFDRDPDASVAFAISHSLGISWSLLSGKLSVATSAGTPLASIQVGQLTINGVSEALTLSGVTVSSLNPALAQLSALVLIDGNGASSPNEPCMLNGHRSILWAILSSYAVEVEDAASRVPLALEQARLHSADGEWIDFWGGFFGVARRPGQLDADYLALIITETTRRRSNKFAIENAIKDATGYVVTIDEPWKRIFTLDVSTLSGGDKFKDGINIGRNLIRPVSAIPIDWSGVLPIVNRNRSAGVIVLSQQVNNGAVIPASDHSMWAYSTRNFFGLSINRPIMRLDIDALDDRPTRNYASDHRREYLHASHAVYPSHPWSRLSWGGSTETWASLKVSVLSNYTRTY